MTLAEYGRTVPLDRMTTLLVGQTMEISVNLNKMTVGTNVDDKGNDKGEVFEGEDPFKRRPKVATTPPQTRRRANSMLEVAVDIELCRLPWEDDVPRAEAEKRKRQEESPEQAAKKKHADTPAPRQGEYVTILVEDWKDIKRKSEGVAAVMLEIKNRVRENTNTKTEIKAATAILVEKVQGLKRRINYAGGKMGRPAKVTEAIYKERVLSKAGRLEEAKRAIEEASTKEQYLKAVGMKWDDR